MGGKIWLLLAIAALLLGCASPSQPSAPTAAPSPTGQPSAPPSFFILIPENNQVLETDSNLADIEVQLSTSNLLIRPPVSANKIGEGHFIIQLDTGERIRVFSKDYTLFNVPVGEHELVVELVHNDGSSYSPQLIQSIRFIVISTLRVAQHYEIEIHDFTYSPSELHIRKGDSVTWTNVGNSPRTVTSTGNFNSATIAVGGNYTLAFNEPGRYEYFSVNYPLMKGVIIVE